MAMLDSQISLLYADRVQTRKKTLSPRPGTKLTMDMPDSPSGSLEVRAPITGYEVIEQREKFTVYKIQVSSNGNSWFVFRRYTDFHRLNTKLREAFPNFSIKLPGRRWFKDNFDSDFIKARAHGLQFFVDNIMHHADICQSAEVKQFFCLDDPPGPYDSLEESRRCSDFWICDVTTSAKGEITKWRISLEIAYCQHLEEQLSDAKQKVQEVAAELSATKSQLTQARVQQEALVSALRAERGNRSNNAETAGNVDVLLTASEKSWRCHAHTLRGNVAHLLPRKLTSPHGEKDSWQRSLEFTVQSSGMERQRSSKATRRSLSALDTPRTSTPTKREDGVESAPLPTSAVKSHEDVSHHSHDSVVRGAEDEGRVRIATASNEVQPSSKRDSGILSDHNDSPE